MISSHRLFMMLVIVAAVGVPGLLQFDRSGLTHDYGLFNIQSYLRIALYLMIAVLLCFTLLARQAPQATPLASYLCGVRLLVSLYAIFLVSALFLSSPSDILLVIYRVCEWSIVIVLVAAAMNDAEATDLLDLIRVICLTVAGIVIIGSIVSPSHTVYAGGSQFRLGGWLYYPNLLGVVCGVGTVAFLSDDGKLWKLRQCNALAAGLLFVMMVLTFSRGALAGFIIGLLPFIYYSDRRITAARIMFAALLCVAAAVAAYSSTNFFIGLAGRGSSEGLENIVTLSARTYVWRASWQAFVESPWIGHGFIVGPKRLGSYMDQAWWSAPNAHNDFFNAAVGGGLPAAVITLLIYITAGWHCLRLKSHTVDKRIVTSIFIQCTAYGIVTPLLSTAASTISIIFVCLIRFVALANRNPE